MARQPELMGDEDHMQAALATLEQGGSAKLPGGVVINERTIFGDIITAQPIKVPRNEPAVLRRIDAMAQANGESWYYRFPVKNKRTGKVDYIEGPSIECADAVARYYGNCQVQTTLAAETHTQWIFASRFVDLETGYSLIRPFLQPKQSSLGGSDDERRLQMAFGTGTSKCQRNVVDHALADVMARAFKAAKNSLVERIGARLPEARTRMVERLRTIGGDPMIARVEQVYQRKVGEWLAPDLARMFAEVKAIDDGMALVDEVWPTAPPPEPKRSDVTDVPEEPATAEPPTASTPAAPGPGDVPAQERAPGSPPAATSDAPEQPSGVKSWALPADLLGQDAVILGLQNLCEDAKTKADVLSIEQANAERIEKITGVKRHALNDLFRTTREALP